MKKYSLLFLMILGCPFWNYAQTIRITNFEDLMKVLNQGDKVRVVMEYGKCRLFDNLIEQPDSPDVTGGMSIDAYEYFASNAVHNKIAFVVFSTAKLIRNPKGKGFVYNYVKVRVNADNSVKINAQYLNAKNFKVQMDELFLGSINDGKNEQGISFFR